jgi:uncharacterized membrane protein YphA (DoxX/SURF4 family)
MTETPLAGRLPETLRTVLDRSSAVLMLRLSLAVIFVWFGALKPLGPSPAVPLVSNAVSPLDAVRYFLPYDLFSLWGWWEAIVGVCLLFRRTTRLAVAMMIPQMLSTIFVRY